MPALRRLKQGELHRSEASLGYIVRPSRKKKEKDRQTGKGGS